MEGRVRAVEIRPVEHSCVFECVIDDGTGALAAMFYGRTGIPGVSPGARLRLEGKVSMRADGPAMINPAYELVGEGMTGWPAREPRRYAYSPGGDELISGVDHHWLAVADARRAGEPDAGTADQAGNVRPAVEHRRQVAGRGR